MLKPVEQTWSWQESAQAHLGHRYQLGMSFAFQFSPWTCCRAKRLLRAVVSITARHCLSLRGHDRRACVTYKLKTLEFDVDTPNAIGLDVRLVNLVGSVSRWLK